MIQSEIQESEGNNGLLSKLQQDFKLPADQLESLKIIEPSILQTLSKIFKIQPNVQKEKQYEITDDELQQAFSRLESDYEKIISQDSVDSEEQLENCQNDLVYVQDQLLSKSLQSGAYKIAEANDKLQKGLLSDVVKTRSQFEEKKIFAQLWSPLKHLHEVFESSLDYEAAAQQTLLNIRLATLAQYLKSERQVAKQVLNFAEEGCGQDQLSKQAPLEESSLQKYHTTAQKKLNTLLSESRYENILLDVNSTKVQEGLTFLENEVLNKQNIFLYDFQKHARLLAQQLKEAHSLDEDFDYEMKRCEQLLARQLKVQNEILEQQEQIQQQDKQYLQDQGFLLEILQRLEQRATLVLKIAQQEYKDVVQDGEALLKCCELTRQMHELYQYAQEIAVCTQSKPKESKILDTDRHFLMTAIYQFQRTTRNNSAIVFKQEILDYLKEFDKERTSSEQRDEAIAENQVFQLQKRAKLLCIGEEAIAAKFGKIQQMQNSALQQMASLYELDTNLTHIGEKVKANEQFLQNQQKKAPFFEGLAHFTLNRLQETRNSFASD